MAACEALSNIAMKNLMEFNVTITATFTKKVYQSTSKQSETSTVVEILEGNNLLQKLRNLIGGDSFLTASALRVLRNLAVCPQPEMRDKIFKIMNFGDLFMLLKCEHSFCYFYLKAFNLRLTNPTFLLFQLKIILLWSRHLLF